MKGIILVSIAFLIIIPPKIITPIKAPSLWVEINDASPAYGTYELSKVIGVLEKHRVERVVIFVIPDHGASAPLSKYPKFVGYLKELQGNGYEIGAHGYTHSGFEFYCSKDKALQLVNQSLEEFSAAGISPRVFSPPRFFVKEESFTVLEENFEEVYLINKVISGGKEHAYPIHEYTWFRLPHWMVMPVAKASYIASTNDVFRLSLHIGRMDSERLEFLDKFLEYVESRNQKGKCEGNTSSALIDCGLKNPAIQNA